VSDLIPGDGFRLRRAAPEDVPFIAGLATHEEVEPFMAAVAARDAHAILEQVERSQEAPDEHGVFVIEEDVGGGAAPAGVIGFELANRRSRIAYLHGLMLHPNFRGRGLARRATELFTRHLLFDAGYHRVQLECYGFNERAIRHFEHAGFVREGARRKAYWRHGEWVDGVLFGLVREDFDVSKPRRPLVVHEDADERANRDNSWLRGPDAPLTE
jgi:RimJ/RimL family protein N-acetyltransferase